MAKDEFERALAYANSAMSLLKRGHVPPYPQFYELFYTYATGVNASLNERINALFAEHDGPSADLAEMLYNQFLRTNNLDERITEVSTQIYKSIDQVHAAIDAASDNATAYTGSLSEASDLFDTESDPVVLRALAQKLMVETRKMQETNQTLEHKLEASREDIESLQRDLEEVQRESMMDALTKLFNRKCFDQTIEKEILDARNKGHSLSLVLIDIDHFKLFNDTFGHQTGDQVLRLVAMTLRAHTKGQDLAARYGGEEFALILPETDVQGATLLSEKVRKSVQAKELLRRSTNEKLGRITASFGVAELGERDTSNSLIERADQALYAAKKAGRNRVVTETSLPKTTDVDEVAA